MENLDKNFLRELQEAYIEGKTGKPCSIYSPLTEQASPEEIKQAADVLPIAPGASRLVEQCTRALYRAYMAAWQIGRKSIETPEK